MSKHGVTFVLVPGSFVVAQEYDKVIKLLENDGHEVQTIELLSADKGDRQPPAQTSDDVEHLRAGILTILDTQHSDVVLAVHSYSGIPGSAATEELDRETRASQGKSTAVVGLMYIASFMPLPGESLRSIMISHDAIQEPYRTGFPGEYLPAIPADFAAYVFNDVNDPEEVKKYHEMMVKHSSDSYGGVAEGVGWRKIKTVQIVPELDFILPTAVQEWMGERARKQGHDVTRVFVEGAGHCPNISRPDLIVQELVKLSGR